MRKLAKFILGVSAYIELVVAMRSLVSEKSIQDWRTDDAIWGPHALPFNAASGVLVAVGYLIAMASPNPFHRSRWLTFGAFIAWHFALCASRGTGFGSPAIAAVVYVAVASGLLDPEPEGQDAPKSVEVETP